MDAPDFNVSTPASEAKPVKRYQKNERHGACEAWITGSLDCWILGFLDCWIVGLLDCWMDLG
jgi:hypothetical protein